MTQGEVLPVGKTQDRQSTQTRDEMTLNPETVKEAGRRIGSRAAKL